MVTMTLSGTQYTIASGPYEAVITEQGAGLRSLTWDGLPLILPHDPDEVTPAGFGQLLAPWPNRVDHGTYTFEGVAQRLEINEPSRETAIHGLVRWESWNLAERTDSSVTLTHRLLGRPGYPFRLDLTAVYTLAADGLNVRLSATNSGTRNAPYGQSAHPYLTVGLPLDECVVTFGGVRYQPVNERLIPSGLPVPVAGTPLDLSAGGVFGDRRIDTAYTDLPFSDGRTWVGLSGGGRTVGLWADESHPWLQLYTADDLGGGDRRAGIAAEPMTCPPNAFNSGVDLITLKPGDTFGGSWGIISL
ncbi:aldose 1-epimerase family protein [Actinocorallia longicatena]|uniref:Aldose 1-epimerase family protein n=2 Tax=Actinocorallia longicatena TaxID=111803 RepID=A0ABP6QDT2_9ACTN